MRKDEIKEGDVCILDTSVEYPMSDSIYEVIILWHGLNSQPLVTKRESYEPFWTTYKQLTRVIDHINMSDAIAKIKTRKGKWIFENRKRLIDENDEGRVYMYDQWWKCSECHYDYGYKKPEFKFCPNCGADMRGENNGNMD